MISFDAGSFSDLASTSLGNELWNFLNEPNNILVMKTATKLSRPALEPLQEDLLNTFGNDVRADRIKQMIGRMARQVMENNGCQLDRNNVKISNNILFSSASRYAFRK